MIAYLNGKFTHITPTYVYIDCHGVGYHVNISLQTYEKISQSVEGKLFVHHHINADTQALYGFFDEEERHMFGLLISVSGIGPNTGRVILSYMTVKEVRQAIIGDNSAAFKKVKGVGPKTAQRIIIDLRDKVMKDTVIDDGIAPIQNNTIIDEALSALVSLGFPKASIEKTLKKVVKDEPQIANVEDMIKAVLKVMR